MAEEHLLKRSSSVWNLYGPTETAVCSTLYQVKPGESPISIGTPISNTQTYVLDSELRMLPVGVAGELYIGGEGLARGYLNRPELTAQNFIGCPFNERPGVRLYKTGDWVRYQPDGNIEFLGRIDHQVKLRGFRIETEEIESVLAGHPAVNEATVIARQDTPGDVSLVAYVVPRAHHSLPIEELRGFLKTKLPDYMIPARFEIEALPVTFNGKVDRQALPAPGTARQKQASAATAPTTAFGNEIRRRFSPKSWDSIGLAWTSLFLPWAETPCVRTH